MTVRVSKPEFNLREKLTELDKPSGIKGSELMRSETAQDARDLVSAGRKNLIINGDMTVAQRGTSFSPTGTEQPYTIDRYQHVATSGVSWDATVTQNSSAPDGFTKSYKVTPDATNTPTGGGNAVIRQTLEGQTLQNLAYGTSSAKQVTVSFYAKSGSQNNGHQYTFQLRHFATDTTKRSINAPFIITSSFQRFTFTFDGDTAVDIINTRTRGLELTWILSSGPNDIVSQHTSWTTIGLFTAVTGQSNFNDNTSNEFYLTGVQLEVGPNATEFEHRLTGEELALCQRYYFKTTNAKGTVYENASSTTNVGLGVDFPVQMRATPTVTLPTSVSSNVHNFGAGDNSYTGGGQYGSNVDGANFYMTGGTSRNSGTYSVLNTNAYVTFDAEII